MKKFYEKFCESLAGHANKIIHFKKKKVIPLTNQIQDHTKMLKHAISTKNIS